MVSFFVIGDWGRRGAPGQRAVARAMATVALERPLQAIISTGDNFYDVGVKSLRDPHWRESFEDVYDDGALAVPWWVCLGNHDNHGCALSQRLYTEVNPRWHMPSRWYRVRQEVAAGVAAEFFFLDTSLMLERHRDGGASPLPALAGLDPQAQFAWLERSLAASTADWKVVIGHHPILSGSRFHGKALELESTLLPLLEAHGVTAYLAGHEHDLQHLTAGAVECVVSGAGADLRETGIAPQTRFARSTLGFAVLTLDERRATLEFVNERAEVIYGTVLGELDGFEARVALP